MKKIIISLDNSRSFSKLSFDDEEYMTLYFESQKAYMNNILNITGVVLIKDVLEAFGIPIIDFTTSSLLCGWFAPITKHNTPDKRYRVKMELKKYKVNNKTKYILILEARQYG